MFQIVSVPGIYPQDHFLFPDGFCCVSTVPLVDPVTLGHPMTILHYTMRYIFCFIAGQFLACPPTCVLGSGNAPGC